MIFEKHSELEGTHAFLSPSQPYWLRYSQDKLVERYLNAQAAEKGTRLHAWARETIELSRMQPRNKDTVNMFVNDAIGYKMTPEQPLFFDFLCYGTADAISYKKNYLRIHDLKTGVTEASFDQLRVYAALFCLNYQRRVRELRNEGKSDAYIAAKFDISPKELHFDPMQMSGIELRIYQMGEVKIEMADPQQIADYMDIAQNWVQVLKKVDAEG